MSHLQDAVVHNADWVNRVLVGGTVIAGIVVLVKALGYDEFEWQDITFSVRSAWLIFMLFTLAHGYAAWLLVRSTHALWEAKLPKEGEETFLKVSSTGSLFVRGMIPRTKLIQHGNGYVYLMDPKDPSTWLAHGAVVLMIIATIPFNFVNPNTTLFPAFTAIVIAVINWQIGSHWVIALSELTVPNEEAHYHLRLAEKGRKAEQQESIKGASKTAGKATKRASGSGGT